MFLSLFKTEHFHTLYVLVFLTESLIWVVVVVSGGEEGPERRPEHRHRPHDQEDQRPPQTGVCVCHMTCSLKTVSPLGICCCWAFQGSYGHGKPGKGMEFKNGCFQARKKMKSQKFCKRHGEVMSTWSFILSDIINVFYKRDTLNTSRYPLFHTRGAS